MVNFIINLYTVLSWGLQAYSVLIIIYILLSWFPGAYESKFGQLLIRICEPYIGFFRRIIPPIGMISLSGVVAIFVLQLADRGLVALFQLILRLVV